MDWIGLAQKGDQWRALANRVLNSRFYKMLGNSRLTAQLATSQEGLSSMKVGN
jgi:hypothetical protein